MTTSSEWLAAFGLRVSPFFKEPESKAALVTDTGPRRLSLQTTFSAMFSVRVSSRTAMM
jgi:hypothetical protein